MLFLSLKNLKFVVIKKSNCVIVQIMMIIMIPCVELWTERALLLKFMIEGRPLRTGSSDVVGRPDRTEDCP